MHNHVGSNFLYVSFCQLSSVCKARYPLLFNDGTWWARQVISPLAITRKHCQASSGMTTFPDEGFEHYFLLSFTIAATFRHFATAAHTFFIPPTHHGESAHRGSSGHPGAYQSRPHLLAHIRFQFRILQLYFFRWHRGRAATSSPIPI